MPRARRPRSRATCRLRRPDGQPALPARDVGSEIAPGQVGQDGYGKWCYGRSLVVDPWGTVLATAPDAETVIAATLDRSLLRDVRRQVPSLANRMPDRYLWPDQVVTLRR